MKKNFVILSLSAMCVCMLADTTDGQGSQIAAADFENLVVGENGLYRSDNPQGKRQQEWESGSFVFTTFVDDAYAPAYYYYDVTVSARTETDFVADYSDGFDMKSAPGGAAEGKNYAVWYYNFYGNAPVLMKATGEVSGMYVTLNTYAKSSILNGDGYARKFGTGDWFKLTVEGGTQGASGVVYKTSVDFYLADFREAGNWRLADKWMWLDLKALGEVSVLRFSLSSSDSGTFGMNTPAYFCFDNLGGTAPASPADYTIVDETTGIEQLENEKSLQPNGRKLFIDGRFYVRKGNQLISL